MSVHHPVSARATVSVGCALLAFFLLPVSSLRAAKPAKDAKDSAPILMSKTGGGGGWADVKELRAAAEKGNPKAEAQFGEMLLRGDAQYGVTQDRPRAIELLEKAARKGEASAAFRIGMLLDDGDGLPQDRARAMAYFRAAAAGGAIEAFHNIGAAYASARGVTRDYAEGLAWLIVAKKRGTESNAEPALRAQIQKLKKPELITAAEKRAEGIERELAGKKVTDLLPPPAPLGAVAAETPPSKGGGKPLPPPAAVAQPKVGAPSGR
ncbi:MAG TPA: tetratricopeptide repeat protein [Opitutaceae bacterium]|nr:tetratricopeptide repeat protein [Opitutaceae bacterium]